MNKWRLGHILWNFPQMLANVDSDLCRNVAWLGLNEKIANIFYKSNRTSAETCDFNLFGFDGLCFFILRSRWLVCLVIITIAVCHHCDGMFLLLIYKSLLKSVTCLGTVTYISPMLHTYSRTYLLIDWESIKRSPHWPKIVLGNMGELAIWRTLGEMSLIPRFTRPTWGPFGADRTQVDPMLAPRTLLSGVF